MAQMKFYVNGVEDCVLDLPVDDNLSDAEYFQLADENKDETLEYVSIYVVFNSSRSNLIILQA